MSFLNTEPAAINPQEGFGRWRRFQVGDPRRRLAWLRRICHGDVPVSLGMPGGAVLTVSLWSVDDTRSRLHFNTEATPQAQQMLGELVSQPEVWAAAYLEQDKIQFLVRQLGAVTQRGRLALDGDGPGDMYHLSRRSAVRVRRTADAAPLARLRGLEGDATLQVWRVANLSPLGCALRLPAGAASLCPGQLLREVEFELDETTFLFADLVVQHTTAEPSGNLRAGCVWSHMSNGALDLMQRWIHRGRRGPWSWFR